MCGPAQTNDFQVHFIFPLKFQCYRGVQVGVGYSANGYALVHLGIVREDEFRIGGWRCVVFTQKRKY
jgi:hypothetical protein